MGICQTLILMPLAYLHYAGIKITSPIIAMMIEKFAQQEVSQAHIDLIYTLLDQYQQ